VESPAAPSPALRPAFLLRHEFLDGGEDHAAARDIQQLAQMLDRVRLHRSLPQDLVATLELAEELIAQVVSA
jgi:hypothetical protein